MLRPFTRVWLALALLGLLLPATSRAGDSTTFLIKKGNHYDTNYLVGLRALQVKTRVDRTVSFRGYFYDNAAYTTSNPQNQSDWNKLMGITTNLIHKNSIRLGWSWRPPRAGDPNSGKMALGFYGYIRGQRISQEITRVPLRTWFDCVLRMHNGGLSVKVNGIEVKRDQSLGFSSVIPTMTWMLQTAYFGGDETAPHDINIRVEGIVAR
jgi:hypothetical protein